MICPVCRIEMIAVERSGIELDHCISCRGLWFDRGELDLLAELTGANLQALGRGERLGEAPRRSCPRCDRTLEEVGVDAIRLDRCPEAHGLWFDRGELSSLVDRALGATGSLAAIGSFLGEVFEVRPRPQD